MFVFKLGRIMQLLHKPECIQCWDVHDWPNPLGLNNHYGQKCPFISSAGFFSGVSGCLEMIVSRVQDVSNGLARSNNKVTLQKHLILMSPLGPSPPDPKSALTVLSLPELISGQEFKDT